MNLAGKIYQGDAKNVLGRFPAGSIDCVMTSPPYWALRDYKVKGQLGMEKTIKEYIKNLCDIFDGVKKALKNTGTCWVNMGDTYSSTRWSKNQGTSGRRNRKETPVIQKQTELPERCLCMIPHRFAIEMVNRGWILRNTIIWKKPNAMPCKTKSRLTVDFEYLFFFVKNKKYQFEQQLEPATYTDRRKGKGTIRYNNRNTKCGVKVSETRNKRCVWNISTKPYRGAHFATYPVELCLTPIRAGCPAGGLVLDPFMGAGTTAVAAKELGREFVGIELSAKYIKLAKERLSQRNLKI